MDELHLIEFSHALHQHAQTMREHVTIMTTLIDAIEGLQTLPPFTVVASTGNE